MSDDRETLPPSDSSDNAAALAVLARLEQGLDKRLGDIHGAMRRQLAEQATEIRALETAIRMSSRESTAGQERILSVVREYADGVTALVTRLEQLTASVEQLWHEHRLNHPQRMSGSLTPNGGL
jgi:methyl-accepting chemotaxis protein